MNFALFLFGWILLLILGPYSIHRGIATMGGGGAGSAGTVRRDDNPRKFLIVVSGQFAVGTICIVLSFFIHDKPLQTVRPSAPGVAPATSPATTLIVESPNDLRIKSRLLHRGVDIMDGRQWKTSLHFRRSDRSVGLLIDQLYKAGAAEVFVDGAGGEGLAAEGPAIYVELPANSHRRNACLAATAAFERTSPGSRVSADSPATARYLEIDVGG